MFGQPASAVSTGFGGFGSTAGTNTGGLFGNTAASGTTTGTGLFGQTQGAAFGGTSTSGFGTSGSLFSAPPTSTTGRSLFGGTTGATQSSLFGGTGTGATTAFGGFGAASTATGQAGTPIKFSVIRGTDQVVKNGLTTNVNTQHQSITVMKEYETKSFEELRFEDYTLGRKSGATGATASTGGLFSATPATSASTGGLFGTTATSTGFGGTSAFGQSKTGFGTASDGLFGQTATSQTGGLFGGTTTTQAGGLFGGGATGFGAATGTTGTGLFGQSTGFGQTSQQSSLFGNKLATSTTGFGATNTGGLLGLSAQKPATGFGTTGLGTGTFGAGTTGTQGLFGNTATAFGKPATGLGTTGFGGTGTGLFGSTTGLGTTTTGLGSGLGGSMLGNTLGQPATGLNLGGVTNNLNIATSNQASLLLAQQQLQQHIMALNNSPFGDSKLFRNSLTEKAKADRVANTTTVNSQRLGSPSHYKVSAKLTAKIKPRPISNHSMNKSQMFDGLEESGVSPDTFVPRKSIKKLVIRNRNTPEQMSGSADNIRLRVANDDEEDLVAPVSPYPPSSHSSRAIQTPPGPMTDLNDSRGSEHTTPIGVRFSCNAGQPLNDTLEDLNARRRDRRVEAEGAADGGDEADGEPALEPCGIILTRPEYYTVPSIEQLNDMVDANGEVWVDDFVVGREGYGEVKFPGKTNVADLNLDEIVFFRRREIEVYPDTYPNKPEVGEELNKKAEITLIKVWPNDKTTHKPIKTPERPKQQGWLERAEAATAKLGATFIDYQPHTGSWVFMVEHFTRYGIHEFLDDENIQKRLKRPPIDTNLKDIDADKEKLAMLEKLRAAQEKQEAYEREKAQRDEIATEQATASASENMQQDEESEDMEDIDQQTFPDEIYEDKEEGGYDSPASHLIASSLGISAHRTQLMKASIFGESEAAPRSPKLKERPGDHSFAMDDDTQRIAFPGIFRHSAAQSPKFHRMLDAPGSGPALFGSPRIGTLPPKFPMAHDFTSAAPSSPMMCPNAVGSAIDMGTKLVGARAHQRDLVPKDDSIVDGKENLIADMGLVMGRSFRVGWGPGFTLVHSGSPLGTQTKKPASMMHSSVTGDALFSRSRLLTESTGGQSPFGVVVERLNIAPDLKPDSPSMLKQHLQALEVELEHCTSSQASDGCPFFEPTPGTKALHQHADVAKKNQETQGSSSSRDVAFQHSLVWDLVVALWGDLGDKDTASQGTYEHQVARRNALSHWLAEAAKDRVKVEVDKANFEDGDYLNAIFSHLTGQQISKASRLAQRHGDYRLSLLLSQATSSSAIRYLLQKQLSDWEQVKADSYMTELRIKVYALLAGCMVWRTSDDFLNTCEDLDWKRVLAVHMWYHNSQTSSISEILSGYEDAFKGRTSYGKYGKPPHPPYREIDEDSESEEEEESGGGVSIRDTCYHLLKLFCKRSHRLERTLAPASYTPHQLDYRLSWHLYQALQSLEYSHLSQYHAGMLHSGFASQLEQLGMWEWAAFVLLHITDKERREHSVRRLLFRHCQLSPSDEHQRKEQFLREKLLIPPEWIHEAKAIRAQHDSMPSEEALHLLKSSHWNRSHNVLISSLASDAIINDDYDTLKALLAEMAPRERSSNIMGWETGGQVLLDFLNINEKFQDLSKGSCEPSKREFEEIHSQVASLCNRINNLPCATAKDRLCQYELAKQCASYLKLTTSELSDHCQDEDAPLPTQMIVPHISKLPLPEDCALAELAELTENYVRETTRV
ncbi:nuclear pore complex protein Nup98-Nup96 isoform X1 [Nematostella vectensis]|uniref:nuclear pore complex protein Nup98-Nup96 isoform X1 n=1 Tax=Nematostella vectensis TaxID=45351 RepID=UPI0020774EA4|nr:nuclear pore complex protein Nup98-Nup96 isoform X1 [Nematostella vectensis]